MRSLSNPLARLDAVHRHRLVTLAAALAAIALAASSDVVHGWIHDAIEMVETSVRRHPVGGVVLFVVFSALSAMLFFFSSAVVVPVGITVWGELATFLLLWLGWLLGGMAAYAVGRFLGRRVVAWVVPSGTPARYEGRIHQKASFPMIVLFQLAVPSEIPGYLLGLVRYVFWRYVAALAIAELPFAVGAVYLGRSFLQRNYLALITVGIIGLVLISVALYLWQRRGETT